MKKDYEKMEKIVSLSRRRGFIFPGSELYGGLQNSWDYGPLGTEVKNNIKQEWWKRFVHGRSDMVGLDAALFMNPRVWEASGHVSGFTDPLVEDKKTHIRYRADHLLEENGIDSKGLSLKQMALIIQTKGIMSPDGNELTEPRQFNLMFRTHIGPVEDDGTIVYMRPETAQGIFVNFPNIVQTTRKRLPFGIAQIGKAFRNEITPGNFIFRMREFEQMEIEYFIPAPENDDEWQKYFDEWVTEIRSWLQHLGVDLANTFELDVPKEELAHYSKKTIDFEYDFPFGRDELYGLAYRGDFDLKNHETASGENTKYRDPVAGTEFWPHVIEPSMGVDRTVLAVLCSAYCEEEVPTSEEGETATRVVMKFPKWLAPVKVAILPLSKKEELVAVAQNIADDLRTSFVTEYDETQSIGKRYRRQDEIGTPYCVTIDFETLEDKAVTVRERDTMRQERIQITNLKEYIHNGLYKENT
ncbi:MAG: glycine--tRNA ligase [bacterium]